MTTDAGHEVEIHSRVKESIQRMKETNQFCRKFVAMFTTIRSVSFADHQLKLALAKTLNAVENLIRKEKREYLRLRSDMQEYGYNIDDIDHAWANLESMFKEVKKQSREYFSGKTQH
jgi:hypothetical protein